MSEAFRAARRDRPRTRAVPILPIVEVREVRTRLPHTIAFVARGVKRPLALMPEVTMRFRYRIHAANGWHVGIAPGFRDREIRRLWRELARSVTFSMCVRHPTRTESESANSLGNGAPGRTRTCAPGLRRQIPRFFHSTHFRPFRNPADSTICGELLKRM